MVDYDVFVDELCRSVTPVRRPLPVSIRAMGLIAAALPCGLLATSLMRTYHPDWAAPSMAWPMAEIILLLITGAAAVILAFNSSIAGRSLHGLGWVLGGGGLWLGVSAANLLTTPQALGSAGDGGYCFRFVMLAGMPMIVLIVLALRGTRSLHPRRTLAIAGSGIALLSLGLLGFCHSADLHLFDFIAHMTAGACIVLFTVVTGQRFIAI